MKWYRYLFFFVFSSVSVFSQEKKAIEHTVSKGETVSEIAKYYNVKPTEIYDLNPEARNGIKYKGILLIPAKATKKSVASIKEEGRNNPLETHEVLPKETLYGIAKQYHITFDALYKINPDLEKEGLKIGQTINVPKSSSDNLIVAKNPEKSIEPEKKDAQKQVSTEAVLTLKTEEKKEVSNATTIHEVLPKESLYSISKQYGISLADLQNANPSLTAEGLKAGQKITIPVKDANSNLLTEKVAVKKVEKVEEAEKAEITQTTIQPTVVAKKEIESGTLHEVLPKESLYSISKQYGITIADLQNANPSLTAESLKAGQKITIPVKDANSNLVIEKVAVNKVENVEKAEKTEKKVRPKVVAKKEIELGTIHEVVAKESFYSISKQYGITLADLQKANPELENKTLRVGQKISIPIKEATHSNAPKIIVEQKNPEIQINHEVLPKETKYGIAKQYGLTVAELEKQNPNSVKKLIVGSVLSITTSKQIEVKTPETIVVKEESDKQESNTNVPMTHDAAFIDQLIATASENIGTRYRSGGTTTDGFDCSGFMYFTFGTYDIKLPRSSIEMASYGAKIDTENAQKGDLIFFKTRGGSRINHVGMVVEVLEGEIKFIHSSTSSGVIISSTKESYYERTFAQVNRVL
jgi:LysM repeat protein